MNDRISKIEYKYNDIQNKYFWNILSKQFRFFNPESYLIYEPLNIFEFLIDPYQLYLFFKNFILSEILKHIFRKD